MKWKFKIGDRVTAFNNKGTILARLPTIELNINRRYGPRYLIAFDKDFEVKNFYGTLQDSKETNQLVVAAEYVYAQYEKKD